MPCPVALPPFETCRMPRSVNCPESRVICPNSTVPYFVTVNDTPQAAPFSSKEMGSSSSRRDL
jgi:hypothetical protein